MNYSFPIELERPRLFPEEELGLNKEAFTAFQMDRITSHPDFKSQFINDCGDFVHILSIRGLFLYASPLSCKELLGFEADELQGHYISEFVHSADLVFVMRELRSAKPEDVINMVCRFKVKSGGYVYVELRGHIYEGEVGKRTRCIIMSGRQKKVGQLCMNHFLLPDVEGRECWAKLSTEGLFFTL
jgi:PAS domain S-box-containing protein